MNYDVEKMSLADMDNVLLECIRGDTTEDDSELVCVMREAEKALESEDGELAKGKVVESQSQQQQQNFDGIGLDER